MNDELTNEQCNIGLAKWHSEHGHEVRCEYGNNVLCIETEFGFSGGVPPYTASLDTMRLIEVLMTNTQMGNYCGVLSAQIGDSYDDWLLLTSQQRARAAFKVLGLGETSE